MSASTSTQGSARLKGKADTMRLGVKEPSSAPQPLPPLLRVKPLNTFTTERETGERNPGLKPCTHELQRTAGPSQALGVAPCEHHLKASVV